MVPVKKIQDAILEMGGHQGRECYRILSMAVYEAWRRQPEMLQMKEIWAEVRKTAHKRTAAAVSKALERAVADLWEYGDREELRKYQRSWEYDMPSPKEFINVVAQRLWRGEKPRKVQAAASNQIQTVHGGEDEIGVNHLFVQLPAEDEGLGHEVVDDPGIALGVAVDGGEGGRVDDGFGTAGAGNFMSDIGGDLGVGEAGEIVVDGNALAEGLMDGLAEGVVKVRLATEDECKAVDGVAVEVHKHLDVIEYGGGEVLRLVHGQEEGLALVLVKMEYLGLNGVKHTGLATLGLQAEYGAKLTVKLHDAHGGQAYILHTVRCCHPER